MSLVETLLPSQIFTPSLSESVLHITGREREDKLTIEESFAIEYIAGVMADSVPIGRLFRSGELYSNLYSFTEQWLARQDDAQPSRRVADFLLLMRGMFPEKLEKEHAMRFYEGLGAGLYWRLHRVGRGAFRQRDGMLAENFSAYGDAIKYARDTHFGVFKDGDWTRIVPYRDSLRKTESPPVVFH